MLDIKKNFRDGVDGYTPATMWFTMGNIDKREMSYQIEGFKKAGINDFFIHPSNRTQGDYLGDYFFRMINHAASEAQRLGMNYWIYDEYNWPSGVAGGQVFRDAPWARRSCLCKITVKAASKETIRFQLPEKDIYNTIPLRFVVDDVDVTVKLFGDSVEWTNITDDEKTLEVYVVKWTTKEYNVCLSGSEVVVPLEGHPDTMDKDAVSVFIQKTHEEYKKHIGEGFGKYVKGVFTDEVTLSYPIHGERTLPWTRLFAQKFLEKNGYDIIPELPRLFQPGQTKLHLDYWETVTSLFLDAYVGMTYDWCTENNLIYTGHLLLEEGILQAVIYNGDPYEYYKLFTWPGIDTICTYYRITDYNYNITGKIATSASRFLNKERVLSETYTLSGWEIRLGDMKRIFHRLAILGISFIQYMGSRYEFSPGFDYPAMTNNWQNPLFKHYDVLSRYISGIQWLIANTTYHARALVFYPLTTARIMYSENPEIDIYSNDLDMTLQGLTNSLLHLQIPFEFGFEQVIDEAEVDNGTLIIKGSTYDVVILPCTTHMREKTFEVLSRFASGGGRIILINGKPEKIIGKEIYDAPPFPNQIAYECRDYEVIRDSSRFDSIKAAPMGVFTDRLHSALGKLSDHIVYIEPHDGILSAVRQNGAAYYVILVNDTGADNQVSGRIVLDVPFRAVNPETGEDKSIEVIGKEFICHFVAYECVVIEISSEITEKPVTQSLSYVGEREEIALEDLSFQIDDFNTALPVTYQVRGESADNIIRAHGVLNSKRVCDIANALTDSDLTLCKRPIDPYNRIESRRDWFGWCPVDNQYPEKGATIVTVYDFSLDEIPESLELISDPQYNTAWYLNDEQLYQTGTKRVWQYANPVFDLTGVAEPGNNRLVSICKLPDYLPDLDSENPEFPVPVAVLKGTFRTFSGSALVTHQDGGNDMDYWNKQGYLCYTGDATYTAHFTAEKDDRLILDIETIDVAEVSVNGHIIGKRLWAPYTFDLSPYVSYGRNKIDIRITSTLSNLVFGSTPSGISSAHLYRIS